MNAAPKPKNELTTVDHQRNALTPMELIDRAITSGAAPDVLAKMMELQERWDKNQARKAFDEAMAAAKAEIPVIIKNKRVGFESKKPGSSRTDYAHEDMGQIARTIDPILGKHGLSYRFRTSSIPNEPVSVTCIISHRLGHSEENTLSAGRDESGNKNAIQGIGSTVTYLQRYTLKAALGLAAAEETDGKTAGEEEFITADQVAALEKEIKDTGGDVARFCAFAKVENLNQIYANRYDAAMAKVKEAGAARKAAGDKK